MKPEPTGNSDHEKRRGRDDAQTPDVSDQPQGAADAAELKSIPDSADGKTHSNAVEGAGAKPTVSNFPSLARISSVVMLFAGILIVGMLFYKVMVGFFIPLFMAAAMVVIFRPLHEWFLAVLNGRRRVAAVATTSVIGSIVLLPVILLIAVAVGQLTGLVSRTNLDDLKSAVERGRARFGLELTHADRFRRLDALAGTFDEVDEPALVQSQIVEAKELIGFLDSEVVGDSPTGESGEIAV